MVTDEQLGKRVRLWLEEVVTYVNSREPGEKDPILVIEKDWGHSPSLTISTKYTHYHLGGPNNTLNKLIEDFYEHCCDVVDPDKAIDWTRTQDDG